MEYKKLLKSLKYISYLQEGNKPRFPKEALIHLSDILTTIKDISGKKDSSIIIGIENPIGNEEVNLLEDGSHVFHHLFPHLFESFDLGKFEKYFEITTKFLSSRNVHSKIKTQIIDFENRDFPMMLEQGYLNCTNAFEAIQARQSFCRTALSTPSNSIFAEISELENIYSHYLSKSVGVFVNNGQFLQSLDYVKALLKDADSTYEKKIIIKTIISHSTSFNLCSKTELSSLLDEYEDKFSSQEIELMRAEISSDPTAFQVKFFSFTNGSLSLESTRNKNISTRISFSIPNACKCTETRQIQIDEETLIVLSTIAAFWADPIFKIKSSWKIANIGWGHFCDIGPEEGGNYTHISIVINKLFTPDVNLTENSNNPIDFSEKEALIGRPFYPHKDFVITTMLKYFDRISKYVDIEKRDISINLFSNYFVQHIDNLTGETIHNRLFALTNPDSYSKTMTRFLGRLSSVNLSDSQITIKDLQITRIETEKNLMEFVKRSIDAFVKHIIENHGGYEFLWKTESGGQIKPCTELEAQHFIFNLLRRFYDLMGIQLSREAISSNGKIDFLITYTNNKRDLLRLCVELKLAHADNIEDGITKQLPAYMRSENCKYGIYLVLWFKGKTFTKPTNYESTQALQSRLDTINSNNGVSSIIIDCSKPTPPSKLK